VIQRKQAARGALGTASLTLPPSSTSCSSVPATGDLHEALAASLFAACSARSRCGSTRAAARPPFRTGTLRTITSARTAHARANRLPDIEQADRTVSKSRRAARTARENRRAGAPADVRRGPTAGEAGGRDRRHGTVVEQRAQRRRAGRRERPPDVPQPTFFDATGRGSSRSPRWRSPRSIGFVFLGSTAAAYTCGNSFNPSPTPPSLELLHATRLRRGRHGRTQAGRRSTTCCRRPPVRTTTSPGRSARSRRGSTSRTTRSVRRTGSTTSSTGPWSSWTDGPGRRATGRRRSTPTSPASRRRAAPPAVPCHRPFNDMPHPFAALVWGRVLYMDTWIRPRHPLLHHRGRAA
jgi:hypothetical protein